MEYERMADDAPDVFDALEQRNAERAPAVPAESVVNDQYKPRLIPLGIKKRGQEGARKPIVTDYELEIIRMRDIDRLSFRIIGRETGYTLGAVTGLYYRSRARLARMAHRYSDWIEEHGIDVDAWMEEEVA